MPMKVCDTPECKRFNETIFGHCIVSRKLSKELEHLVAWKYSLGASSCCIEFFREKLAVFSVFLLRSHFPFDSYLDACVLCQCATFGSASLDPLYILHSILHYIRVEQQQQKLTIFPLVLCMYFFSHSSLDFS